MKNLYFFFIVIFFCPLKIYSQDEFSKRSYHFTDSLFIKNLDLSNSKKYIDSAIYYGKKTGSKDQLAYVYSSIGFFFNKVKAFENSLEFFKKSNEYATETHNNYIINSNYYSISLIYFQLGDFKESKAYLIKSYNYFIINQRTQSDKLALLNVLNRLSFIEVINDDIEKSKFYNNLEFTYSENPLIINDYKYMLSLPVKNKGIILYKEKKYLESIEHLKRTISDFEKKNIYYWLSISYSFIGNNYLALKDENKAYSYFLKVDSIFKKHKETDPLIRNGLEQLNVLNKKNNNINKQLESINTLIEFDSLHNVRNTNLSKKFYGDFLSGELKKEKIELEKKIIFKEKLNLLVIILFIITCLFSIVIFIINKKKNKILKLKFQKVLEGYIIEINSLKKGSLKKENKVEDKIIIKKLNDGFIDDYIINDILIKLEELEKENYFLDLNTNLKSTSVCLKTNTNYLSYVINTKKGMNFPSYINKLRINYIIKEIIENKKIRNMSMDGIANCAGFKTRQNFSDTFLEVTGMRPSYFISNIDKIDINEYIG
ncbi:helix-turn-helix domain-containing protein [Faecalibacter rhinopitheci]|uniref:AraC family transcriptional regulator n=1 Tax=Faecalibacter rhinopitheci TaxID=2779678 RepID=A0A8J7FPH2_9FLAO|nr:helix-turn-helix domain-containing protein [Faecalibacter rhinopitheci]MBF0598327.1 AraC family transcriptional regulator [Faecalibacter rhinopitheci]